MSELDNREVEVDGALEEETSNAATIQAKPTVSRTELIRMLVASATKLGPEEVADFVARLGSAEEMTKSNDEIYASTQQAAGNAGKNKASIKSSGAPSEPMHSVKEDLAMIFGGSDELSEDFRTKTEALFEAAVATRVDLERVKIEEELTESFSSSLNEAIQEMTENVDNYLNYAVAEWIAENKLAIEQSIRTDVMESFLTGLRGLFAEHYVDIPEDKVDVVESLAARNEELEAQVNEMAEKNIELSKQLAEMEVVKTADELSEGMTDTQREKFSKLIEAVDYSTAEEFRKKASIIKETYFAGKGEVKVTADQLLSESVDEPEQAPRLDPEMSLYVSSLSRFTKK